MTFDFTVLVPIRVSVDIEPKLRKIPKALRELAERQAVRVVKACMSSADEAANVACEAGEAVDIRIAYDKIVGV